MKKFIRKIVAMAVAVVCISTSFSVVTACNGKSSAATVNVWTASGTEKIMRATDYSSRYENNNLEFGVFRNEYESAQIIISSNKKLEYTVEVSDLTDSNGNLLTSDAFEVYHEKYITVDVKRNVECTLGTGDYPDAILPYDKAVEYKENYTTAGQNQGVWIMVNPSKTQQAGVFTGDFTVKVGDKNYKVPVSVTVYDYTLSDEVHMKTSFGSSDSNIQVYEMDSTKEMYDAYREFYFQHRISTTVPYTAYYSNNLDMFFDYVLSYTLDERCSRIEIPWAKIVNAYSVELTKDGELAIGDERGKDGNTTENITVYDYDKMESILYDFVSHSFKNNIDLFQKASINGTIVDEFDLVSGNSGKIKALYNLRRVDNLLNRMSKVIEYLEYSNGKVKVTKEISFDSENEDAGIGYFIKDAEEPYLIECSVTEKEFNALKESLVESCKGIRVVVTTTYYSIFEEYRQYTKSDYCPRITAYNTEQARNGMKEYAEASDSDLWTYICGEPHNPYSTYQIDDYLLSSRLLSWMMYDYDIVGILYWSTELGRHTSSLTESSQLYTQDYYQNALRDNSANGDGFLVYPGRTYGINGPVSSIRLESIRDGIEDYDLMWALEDLYKQRGVEEKEFDEVFSLIAKGLYIGTVCSYDDDYLNTFAAAREKLANLLVLAANDGVIIEKYEQVADKGTFVISTKENTVVKNNGSILTGVKDGELVKYTVTVDLSKGEQNNVFEFTTDGNTRTLTFGTSKATIYDQNELSKVSSVKSTDTYTEGENSYKKYSLVKGNNKNYVQIDLKIEDYNFDKSCDKLVLKYYYDGDENTNVTLKVRVKDAAYATIRTVAVSKGWNEVVLDIADSGVSKAGVLEYVRLRFDNVDTSLPVGDVNVAFDYLVIYGG